MSRHASVVAPLPTTKDSANPSSNSGISARGLAIAATAGVAYAGYVYLSRQAAAPRKPWEKDLATNNAYSIALTKAANKRSNAPETLQERVTRQLSERFPGFVPRPALSSEIVLEFTEFVDVPSESVGNCQEVELTARGEIRLHSFVDRPIRATLRLASAAGGSNAASFRAGAGSFRQSSDPTSTGTTPRTTGSFSNTGCFPEKRTFSDIVDEGLAKTSNNQLRFIPGRADTNLLMTYEAQSSSQVEPAVTCRDCCSFADSTIGQRRLRIALEATKPALDVCLNLILPKGGELRAPPELSRGIWGRPEGGAPGEFQWIAGDVGVAGNDIIPDTPRPLWCEWVYYVPTGTNAEVSFRSGPNTPRERRAANGLQDLNEQSVEFDPNPSVTLSYAAAVSATGLKARRIVIEQRTEEGGWQPMSTADDNAAAVGTSVSYRTMYSQNLKINNSTD